MTIGHAGAASEPFAVRGRVLIGGALVDAAVVVERGAIADVVRGAGALPPRVYDAAIVAPGFIDLQTNGGFGVEVGADANALVTMSARLPETGVTAYVDSLTAVMLLVVTGVGFLIHLYSAGYMHDDPGYARFFAYLNLFVFSMTMLVLAGNFLLLYVFWEAVGLCSYLLIGFWYTRPAAAEAE